MRSVGIIGQPHEDDMLNKANGTTAIPDDVDRASCGMRRPRRLVIVEDEAITALHLQVMLSQLGYQICSVEMTGEGAIAAAKAHHPDLILMDVRLAGALDGIAAADTIRRLYGVPSLLVTAFTDPGTVARAEEVETVGLLPKPYTAQQVENVVQQALTAVCGRGEPRGG